MSVKLSSLTATIPAIAAEQPSVTVTLKLLHQEQSAQIVPSRPMLEDAPAPVAKWVHSMLAAHAASLDVLPIDFCA